jgi:hypothetical protein
MGLPSTSFAVRVFSVSRLAQPLATPARQAMRERERSPIQSASSGVRRAERSAKPGEAAMSDGPASF